MKGILVLLGLFLKCFQLSSAKIDAANVVDYRRQNGYMDNSFRRISPMSHHLTIRMRSAALANYHRFNNSNATGKLDEDAKKLTKLPRCGVTDYIPRMSKRYVLKGGKWYKKSLTYKIWSYPEGMAKKDVDAEIIRAFKTWTYYVDIEINPVLGGIPADFNIEFVYRNHGDDDEFDGQGGILAHAAYPIYGGSIHFDASETWTKCSSEGYNLYQVAVHEIGHALGLAHTSRRASVMYPNYHRYSRSFHLDRGDILAIQSLYGKKRYLL